MKIYKVLKEIEKRKADFQPFGDIPTKDTKDKQSQELIGDAVLLYRELKEILPQEQAQRITRETITASAIAQLKCLIPKIRKKAINKMDQETKKQMFCGIIDKFPNADWHLKKAEGDEYSFVITRCRLVELIKAAGHPELKDAFCHGDKVYFEKHQKDLDFYRPYLIGADDKICDFRFKIRE